MRINKKANRLKLANILERRLTDEQFDMRQFANECGTVGCALGWAALSGEFPGLGWNKDWAGIFPVIKGEEHEWEEVGYMFFGGEATDLVFYNDDSRSRKTVADELRAI